MYPLHYLGRKMPHHLAWLLLASLLLAGCSNDPPIAVGNKEASARPSPDETVTMLLETIPHVKVDADWQRTPAFFVESRTPQMTQADCGKCHAPIVNAVSEAVPLPHADIQLTHGRPGQLACATCHTENQPQQFIAGATKTTSFDHAYTLCSTCHFQQAKDWQNGAHGKRLAGWAGPRVVRNCTGCHNPHNPRIPSAMPVAQPRIIRKGLEGHNHE